MLEIAILTCLEASVLIGRVEKDYNLPKNIREEIIIELINRSECRNGDV